MNNGDCISRAALLEVYKKWIPQLEREEDEGDRRGVETCIAVLEDFKAVTPDAPHGRWVHDNETGLDHCTACNEEPSDGWWSPYCPNCGADMREVDDATL